MDRPRLKSLHLTNFRLHTSLALDFSPEKNLIIGPNASGKTAIIEAVYLASTGESFRAKKIAEMIAFEQELARVKLTVKSEKLEVKEDSTEDELEVLLTRGMVQGKKTQYRLFSINEVRKRKKDFVGRFQTVLFRPEDMRLIEGSPTRRRNFLDQTLASLFYEYRVSLSTYENTLKRRNRLLLSVREGEQSRRALEFWNLSLVKNGQVIQEYRRRFLEFLNTVDLPFKYTVEYLPKVIDSKRQLKYLEREIAAGHSLIGPHKDDLRVSFFEPTASDWLDVAVYGSRGQQRLAVLWLKAGASKYIESQTGKQVIWLLDDILSELDEASRKLVLDLIQDRQALITTTSKRVGGLVGAERVIKLIVKR